MKITGDSASALNYFQDTGGDRNGVEQNGALPQVPATTDRYLPSTPETDAGALALDTVSLSSTQPVSEAQGELTPRLAALKQAIGEGTYQVSATTLAESMIKKAFVESTPESYANQGKWLT